MSSREHNIQNEIRLELSKHGIVTFRANSGQAWQSNDITKLPGGDIILRHPRPFQAMPSGFSDLFGITSRVITQDDVGKTLGVFTAIECKTAKGVLSERQKHFIDFVTKQGGIAGVARSTDEALEIVHMGGADVER